MARPGPAGKAIKHGKPTSAEWHEVDDKPYAGPSPELPRLPRRKKWHPLVEQWWAIVRVMPHCTLWAASDWQFALELALEKNAYWEAFDAGTATQAQSTEIRRREDLIGTTAEARRKLGIRYVEVQPEAPETEPEFELDVVEESAPAAEHSATVTPLKDRRARLARKTAAG